MSIFDKIKHGMDKAGQAAKDAAQDAGKAVKNTAEGAGHAIEDTAVNAISGTKDLAREAKETGVDITGEIKGLVNKADKEIGDLKNKALKEIRNAEQSAQRNVESTGKSVAGGIEHAVMDELPKQIATVLSGLASEAVKPGLKGAAALARSMGKEMDALAKEDPELVKAINQCGFRLKIKANVELILVYQQFYTRTREMVAILDRAGNEGIAFRRRDLIGFVEAMGPTTVAFGAGAEISLGFDLGASVSLTAIPLKLFTRLADRGLKELGVPE